MQADQKQRQRAPRTFFLEKRKGVKTLPGIDNGSCDGAKTRLPSPLSPNSACEAQQYE